MEECVKDGEIWDLVQSSEVKGDGDFGEKRAVLMFCLV